MNNMIVLYLVSCDLPGKYIKSKSSGSYNRRGWVDVLII